MKRKTPLRYARINSDVINSSEIINRCFAKIEKNTKLDKKQFKKFIIKYCKLSMEEAIESGIPVDFPHIGRLEPIDKPLLKKIVDKETKEKVYIKRVDFGATNKLWIKLYGAHNTPEVKSIPNKPVIYHLNFQARSRPGMNWLHLRSDISVSYAYTYYPTRQYVKLMAAKYKQGKVYTNKVITAIKTRPI